MLEKDNEVTPVESVMAVFQELISKTTITEKHLPQIKYFLESIEEINLMRIMRYLLVHMNVIGDSDVDAMEKSYIITLISEIKSYLKQQRRFVGESLIERLCDLEHEQWITWSKSVASEVGDERRKRWETYWVPYRQLDEEVQAHDRMWSKHVLGALQVEVEKDRVEQCKAFVKKLQYAMDVNFNDQFDKDTYETFRTNVMNEVIMELQQERFGAGS